MITVTVTMLNLYTLAYLFSYFHVTREMRPCTYVPEATSDI
jgi:hypothetical protein